MSVLVIPIDASQISETDRSQQRVKVAVQSGDKVVSQVVAVKDGKAEARLDVDPKQSLAVAVGPENASDEDIFHLQTLTANISATQWGTQKTLEMPAFRLTPTWWRFWLFWCREFDIEGRVICADGSPVPGAEVKAFDVNFFWWWSSINQVGPTAVTDASGHFSIKFRWCCGWLPWWWWRLRAWRLEPLLVEKINPVLNLNPQLKFRTPQPTPTLDLFAAQPHLSTPSLATVASPTLPLPPPRISSLATQLPIKPIQAPLASSALDPSTIPQLRDQLTAHLPHVPELERLRIWPWWPWTPWLDCSPDIIFRVTQNCGGVQNKLIVNENIFQTRWDIPTNLTVTLVANQEACCIQRPGTQPPGDCVVFTDVCGISVNNIGGNAAAPAAPVGYASPGNRDRPFSEAITIDALFGSSSQADFYEIESKPEGAPPAAWAPVPAPALLDISRTYFDGTQPFPNQWFGAGFPVQTFGTHHVYESRHHYEVRTSPPNNWGSPFGRAWVSNPDLIAYIQTANHFNDGAYDFRVVGYKALPNNTPDFATRKVMDGCGNAPQNNNLVLRFDNRIATPPPPDNVHWATTEPDCGITAVRLGGTLVEPCGAQQLKAGTPVEIDFFTTDPDGHLDHYEIYLKYDLGSIKNLLSTADVGSHSLSVISGGPEGPDYSNAVAAPQNSPRPTWKGGSLRLHIDDASKVFPKTCCYLIELTVYKRNIVSCYGGLAYYNQMHYSFTITV